jgi:hypothetical protein
MAADPFVGAWKLNLTKSKYSPGVDPSPKNQEITITAQENGIKLVGDTVDSEGECIALRNCQKNVLAGITQ